MDTWAVSQFVAVIEKFVDAYRERTQQQRHAAEAIVQIQAEQMRLVREQMEK